MNLPTWILSIKKYTKELEEKLQEIKDISDLEERNTEINISKANFGGEGKLGVLKRTRPNSLVGDVSYLNKYKELLKELEDLDGEASKNFNEKKRKEQKEQQDKDYESKSSRCSYCKKTPPTEHYIYSEKNKELKLRKRDAVPCKKEYLFCSETHFEKWYNKNHYSCDECFEEKWDGKYKKNKKDNQKFCSDHCFFTHYAEKCDDCYEKCLTIYKNKATGFAQTYYRDPQDKTGILCSKCHAEKLKEEAEGKRKDKEWEESCKRLDKSRDELVDEMIDVARGKGDSEDKNEEDVDNQESRIKNQLQTFQSNLIHSVELTNQGDLVITYQSNSGQNTSTVKNETLSPALAKVKENMEKNGQTKLTKEELEQQLRELEQKKQKGQEQKPPKDSNLGLKIGLGVLVGVGLVLVIIVIKVRKNKH